MQWEESSKHVERCNGQNWDAKLVAKLGEWRQWFEKEDYVARCGNVTKGEHASWQDVQPMADQSLADQSTKAPTPAEVKKALASAECTQLDCIHKLPKGVLVARSEKWAKRKREYFAYCMRCSAWLSCSNGEAVNHTCEGRGWDKKLAAIADEWEPMLKQMRCAEAAGANPFASKIDLRDTVWDSIKLQPAQSYLLRWKDEQLPVPLEMFISTPGDPTVMDVVLYFHGSTEKYTKAPADISKRALISLESPEKMQWPGEATPRNYFWFHTGSKNAYEKFNFDRLTVSQELLNTVSRAVDAAYNLLWELSVQCRAAQQAVLPPRLLVLGCSMGAYAALEYAGFAPQHIAAVACMAGYYDKREAEALVQRIASIPLLVVHHERDSVCPCQPMKHLVEVRRKLAPALTDGWFLPGDAHCGDEADRQKALDWLVAATAV